MGTVYNNGNGRIRDYGSEADYADGVMRWKSNGAVPPAEYVLEAQAAGMPVDVAACDRVRSEELQAFLREYRANPPQLTAEDLAEIRAEFGPDAKVVNVITGERVL